MKTCRFDIKKVQGYPFAAGKAAQDEYGYEKGHPLIRPYFESSFPVKYYYWKKMELICSLYKYDPRSVVLDIGCGPGIFIPTLAKFFSKVIAVDINGDDIEIAQKICSSLGIQNTTFLLADAAKAPVDRESVDIVFSIDVFEHIKDLIPSIEGLHAIIKKDGILVVSAPTENRFNDIARKLMGYTKPDTHYYTSREIEKMLGSRFRLLKRKRLFNLPRMLSPAEVFVFIKT
jgi:ubiquinone/menaquinone biosynthesis C-methylase UbiE